MKYKHIKVICYIILVNAILLTGCTGLQDKKAQEESKTDIETKFNDISALAQDNQYESTSEVQDEISDVLFEDLDPLPEMELDPRFINKKIVTHESYVTDELDNKPIGWEFSYFSEMDEEEAVEYFIGVIEEIGGTESVEQYDLDMGGGPMKGISITYFNSELRILIIKEEAFYGVSDNLNQIQSPKLPFNFSTRISIQRDLTGVY